ncbi:hypothetical protein [Spirosoma endophyticum]|uniref:Lipoprotein n=1 Tax=Spirosoma endophyticum TaxID=662367 RepID=A0A1I2G8Q6_9BACT|nr:hypothetical protein [Spirosoma endophyticum]SFF13360.1 hypothetical protein SAMN05216167_13031 [Spirosoma endophyticum]
MKWLLLLSSLIGSVTGCQQVQQPEKPATVIDLTLPGPTVYCNCCAGYRIQVDADYYYTNAIPAAYDKPNTPIWIRYQADTGPCQGKAG